VRFEGRVFKSGKWWAIEVPLLGVFTQGRSKQDAYRMVKDAMEMLADVRGFKVDVYPASGEHFEVSSRDQRTLFALLLKRQRQMQGLSLSQVSKRLGLRSRNAYARYERGESLPTVPKLAELLKAVNPKGDFVLKETA